MVMRKSLEEYVENQADKIYKKNKKKERYSASGLLKFLAWLTLIGGILGGAIVGYGLATSNDYGEVVNVEQFITFWFVTSGASIMWFAILFGLSELIEATNRIAKNLDTRKRQG